MMTSTTPNPRRVSPLRRIFGVRAWRKADPMTEFIAERIKSAPGARLALSSLWREWQRHADAHGLEHGSPADVISAVRRVYPETRRVKARSGRDVHKGTHLTGIFLR